jgi:hypothetical protein
VPVFAHGYAVHEKKCHKCYEFPIQGVCFTCRYCKNLSMCQKCFFESPGLGSKTHKEFHEMEMVLEEAGPGTKEFLCGNCRRVIARDCFSCLNCYKLFLCGACHPLRKGLKSLAHSHKSFHQFRQVF